MIAAAVNRFEVAERMRIAAATDIVTSLPNRATFRDALDLQLILTAKAGAMVSLLLTDLDRFKQINDLLGHQVGDAALCAFAARVKDAIPESAILARLGGDEFLALLPGATAAAAAGYAQRILNALREPFSVGGRNVDLRASLGISTFPADGKIPAQLIRNADLALPTTRMATPQGIEDATAAAMLSRKGCTLGQGYFFGRPVSSGQVAELLAAPREAA